MRTFVIGDIHGGLKALEQVLERAKISPKDTLIFVGDYVDGWSDSAKTVAFLIELDKQNPCVFLRGNHDELAHHWLKTGELNETWLQHGGQSSVDVYQKLSEEEIKRHFRFFEKLSNYYIDEENRLFLHAGFTSLHGPQQEPSPNMVYWDRTLWEMALKVNKKIPREDDRYPKRLKLFKEIYIGHTPTVRNGKTRPMQAANVWNVDTGAAFTGPLSCMDIETKDVFQSDPVWTLYPEERGRN